jgi:hypothetical protein
MEFTASGSDGIVVLLHNGESAAAARESARCRMISKCF